MPRTAPAKPFVLVDFDRLSNIQTALGHAVGESEDAGFKKSAERLSRKLLAYEDRVYKKSPQETEIELTEGEYETLLNALEFFTATAEHMPIFRKTIGELWSWMMLEGGHLDLKELTKLRKKYGLE
jgi:hypothetical protein